MPSWLRTIFTALLIGIGIVTAHSAHGGDTFPSGRVIAVLHRFASHSGPGAQLQTEDGVIGVSDNRRILFAILATRNQGGPGQSITYDDQRVVVFDVSDPHAPHRLATIPEGSRFAKGLPLAGGSLYIHPLAGKYPGGLVLVGPRGLSGIKGTRGFTVYDRSGQKAITGDLSTLYLWNLKTDPPQMTASIGLGAEPSDARFLASPGVIAVTNSRGIELVSTAPTSYDPERLRQAHRRLLARYNDVLARHGGKLDPVTASQDVYDQFVAVMKDVGVTKLMSSEAGLTHLERVRILNDYGYWLSQSNDPSPAVRVLTKVVELDPSRAVAQLDLANAALAALPIAGTWQEKQALSECVVAAQAAYQRLTGKTLPGAAAFANFNVATAANDDICDYAAGFYNRDRQAEMFGFPNPVDIDGSGKLRYVYIYHQGTADVPGIVASPTPLNHDDLIYGGEPAGDVNFFISNDRSSPDFGLEPHVFPFHSAYYVVYSRRGPVSVYRPDHGAVCLFRPHYTPVLSVDRDAIICTRALAGESFERVPTQDLRRVQALPGVGAVSHLGPAQLGAIAKVTLDPASGPVTVGYFGVASTTGRGCDLAGIAILDKDRVENSPRNRDLLTVEDKTLGCNGAKAFLVRVGGRTLIEMDSRQLDGSYAIARTLFQMRGEHVAPICRIVQHAIYKPERIQGLGDPAKP